MVNPVVGVTLKTGYSVRISRLTARGWFAPEVLSTNVTALV